MTPIRVLLAGLLALAVLPGQAAEPKANRLFGAKATASPHRPAVFGTYAKGCAAGLAQLPETGPTWQAMRLSRNRNWGHPEMIAYLQRLSRVAAQQPGWRGLYVGDISQPRGGPMTSGHSSHQVGLDADIWMRPATDLGLSRSAREQISSTDMRSRDQRNVTAAWTAQHAAILKAAASDPAVDRIFVTPPVKIQLCRMANNGRSPADRAWLQKIRPLYGHNTHFHVRLKCPGGSAGCQPQSPTVAELSNGGSGCDASLNWWVTDYLDPPKNAGPPPPRTPPRRGARDFTMGDLPQQCGTVLSAN